jgi:cobalt-zinc-cadmium efflux system outer membrane protein
MSSIRFFRARWALAAALGAVVLSGCQTYSPMPIRDGDVAASWLARDAASRELREWAATLNQRATGEQSTAIGSTDGGADARRLVYDPSDGITCDEAVLVALFFNAELRAARSASRVQAAGAEQAGRWEDPSFGVDLARVLQSVPEPWRIGASIGITLPLFGRQDAERDAASAEARAATAEAALAEWRVVGDVRAHWLAWSVALRRVDALETHIADMATVGRIAAKLQSLDEIPAAAARAIAIEQAGAEDARAELLAEAEAERLRLVALMGLVPGAPVKLLPGQVNADELPVGGPIDQPPVGWKPESVTERAAVPAWQERLERSSIELALRRAHHDSAEQSLKLEINKQYPGLTLGPGVEKDQGETSAGVGIGITLPLFDGNARGIAEARAKRDAAASEYAAAYEGAVAELAAAQLAANAAAARKHRLAAGLMLLVDKQLQELAALAERGEFDPLMQLEALRARLEARESVLAAEAAAGGARLRMAAVLGPPRALPVVNAPVNAAGLAGSEAAASGTAGKGGK